MVLEQKDFGRYVGVYFDKQMSWSKHIEITNSKFYFWNLEYGNLALCTAPKAKIELINIRIKCYIRTTMGI